MKFFYTKFLFLTLFITLSACKKEEKTTAIPTTKETVQKNEMEYSSNLSIYKYQGYSVVRVINPWPEANKNFTYILKQKNATVPDSLQKYKQLNVPLHSIVVTSTTNIPFLEMLQEEKSLVGFPNTDYVSSVKTRKLIDAGTVKNVGQNESLNIEKIIDLAPEAIVTFGIDNNNPMLANLEKSGLNVLIQADWMEKSPLGKAEWIKFYAALFGKEKEGKILFDSIVKNYKEALQLVANQKPETTVLYGSMYQNQWYVAKGNSWVAQFIKDAKANYLWSGIQGSGSLGLSFENVLLKAKNAKVWIATGSFKNIAELAQSNPHYTQFDAFTTQNIYTFESKLGSTGGTIYYELAPSRPDLVLKDYIKIFHPELLLKYNFTFAQKLN
ncbi:MAG: ABC transporter substrate-binding protein [Flavobacterium sp.]